MSKRETPMTRAYWDSIGGTLVEEFCAVRRSKTCGQRLIDGVVLLNKEKKIVKGTNFDEKEIEGADIVVIQAKDYRLGMYLMGQALFSAELMKKFKPRSIVSVALVSKDDKTMRELLEAHSNMKVVVIGKERWTTP